MEEEHAQRPNHRLKADTLATSVVILLAMTVVQRTIGFGRGILFCRWLEPAELGKWEMAYSFLLLAAPLVVLGIPGSFGRYIERYRQQNQLKVFLRRTGIWTAACSTIAVMIIVLAAPSFSKLILGEPSQQGLVYLIALALSSIILHHFLEALFAGLRMFRVVSMMHFGQSVGFAILALILLKAWSLSAASIVIAYGAACLFSSIAALMWSRTTLVQPTLKTQAIPHKTFWPILLGFAFWVWMTNLFSNLFAVVDRYMIIHWSSFAPTEALTQVGNYHSSRLIPLLLVSVADLLGSMLLPHLSHDWESNNKEKVFATLNLMVKSVAVGMLLCSVVVLTCAPFIFTYALANKYVGGLNVLPGTFAYCAVNGIATIAIAYLWCVEKSRLSVMPMILGLLVNVILNAVLLPIWGLAGAVAATTCANAATLTLILFLCHREGMTWNRGTVFLAYSPLAVCGGPVSATAMCALVCGLFVAKPQVLLSAQERLQLGHLYTTGRKRFSAVWTKLPLGRRRHSMQS